MTLVAAPTSPLAGALLAPDLTTIMERATLLAEGARAEATRRAYRSDWAHFDLWCRDRGLLSLPAAPETVGLYLAAHAETLAVATLTRRLSTIATAHRMAGHGLDTATRRSATCCGACAARRVSPSATLRPSRRRC